jgi:DNA-binding NtrC family response regulator
MIQRRKILVVTQSTSLGGSLLTWLSDTSHELVFATTFAAAKLHLDARPDLVITEVKLGEYNGLHLALRGRAVGVPSIVLGPIDETFRRQAEQLGAAYESTDIECEQLRSLVEKMIGETTSPEPEPFSWYGLSATASASADFASATLKAFATGPGDRPLVVH